ncbi:lyso-ornithine lipid acyltransferase [Poseidonocella pacifica]|uniref:Lyso-ornithine lipid acyltransferase n=1 Tax=Poseidonocella pacifica TaxID=871651 RepID=A0A1I0X4H8_9RHOB|nr:lysophospholipid acyltransferase family protein [Poseidonocella pacifica]SFA95290.1 lyso-ornithine lipid acyltransferase [Poseidonocella pacifica]
MTTWRPEEGLPAPRFGAREWLRVVRRGVPVAALVTAGFLLMVLSRLIERPIFGARRPVTPFLTQGVSRKVFRLIGMRHISHGQPLRGRGAVVANHVSWLDIFALNARKNIYFVAKAEVASWPAIGPLARGTGTVFIRRERTDAKRQEAVFRERLDAGHRLLFFPEGTSTDGLRVLPFKPTLFAAFFAPHLRDSLQIQPVTLVYHAPEGEDPRFYGWWGTMDFASHLLKVLAARKQGRVEVIYHPPVSVADFADRKVLAAEMELCVRSGLEGALAPHARK